MTGHMGFMLIDLTVGTEMKYLGQCNSGYDLKDIPPRGLLAQMVPTH